MPRTLYSPRIFRRANFITSSKVSLPQNWAEYLNQKLKQDKMESAQSVSAFVQKTKKE